MRSNPNGADSQEKFTMTMTGNEIQPSLQDSKVAQRSNPAAFTSLSSPQVMNQFIHDFAQLQRDWKDKTVEQRKLKIQALVDKTYQSIGLRPIKKVSIAPLSPSPIGGTQGTFNFKNWEIILNRAMLESPQLSNQTAEVLANMLYHEMRHGEQFFRIAQLLATHPPDGKPRTLEQIIAQTQIPQDIAEKAIQSAQTQPLTPEQITQATQWYDSIYGRNQEYRRKTTIDYTNAQTAVAPQRQLYMQKLQEYDTLRVKFDPSNRAQRQRLETLRAELEVLRAQTDGAVKPFRDKYKALPEERDAYQIGDALGKLYREKTSSKKSQMPEPSVDLADSELPPIASIEYSNATEMEAGILFGNAVNDAIDYLYDNRHTQGAKNLTLQKETDFSLHYATEEVMDRYPNLSASSLDMMRALVMEQWTSPTAQKTDVVQEPAVVARGGDDQLAL
jgi:hypothetical protein